MRAVLKMYMVRLILVMLAIGIEASVNGQSLVVLHSPAELTKKTQQDPSQGLVDLTTAVPHLKLDLRYASTHNFKGVRLYPKGQHRSYLRRDPAAALAQAAKELEAEGLGIWVWDAYRPYSVTVRFWEMIGDERYVAHPSKGSGHNRGIAVDLTLYDMKTGKVLDMPTEFDDFSESAHHGYAALTEKKISNRELLRVVMERNGFIKFQTEWWHYYWPNADRYDVLDIPFNELKKELRAVEQ